ncbi:TetR/AcrR family transcriptional regulator [Bacillus sp. HMF5848]|uniref:TetR/AcrR family transcriptional regulator n=1 Tax=Bacillus sp. HMF5848 TaxID=2495421 RepID=UPI000F782BC0|nr:TetR/AcrR family transcriptional regulator [Bacillus sp. HMF5848]RSK28647.1 TetR/AcrR family transcriptional regulator [Bacillus sp. HMF5848]
MNDRKKLIIEEAMKLFATKGFHATSIQEVATNSNVSKGTVYTYFTSKDELLLEVFRYYYDTIKQKVETVDVEKQLLPKERFIQQITVFFTMFERNKEFILVHIREGVPIYEAIEEFIMNIKRETQQWYAESLTAIYGDRIHPYVIDIAVLFDGMLESYLKVLMFGQMSLDYPITARFLVNRLDDIVEGLLKREEEPVLKGIPIMLPSLCSSQTSLDRLQAALQELQQLIDDLPVSQQDRDDLCDTVQILKEEAYKQEPKRVIINGMLANLERIHELRPYVKKIQLYIN